MVFQRYNLWWGNNVKRVKRTMRARLRWQESQWLQNVDHCCLCHWAVEVAKKHDGVSSATLHASLASYMFFSVKFRNIIQVTQQMLDEMVASFMNGILGHVKTKLVFSLALFVFWQIYLLLVFPQISSGTTTKIWRLWFLQSPTTWKSKCWACSRITSRRVFKRLLVGLLAKMCQQMSKMLRTGGVDIYSICIFGDVIFKDFVYSSLNFAVTWNPAIYPEKPQRTLSTRWFAQVWLMTTKRLWASTWSETRSDQICFFSYFLPCQQPCSQVDGHRHVAKAT